MSGALDMALDDLIKNSKKEPRGGSNSNSNNRRGARNGGGGRNGGSRSVSGPIRRSNVPRSRPSPYFMATRGAPEEGQWEHDLFEEGSGAAPLKPNMGIETGTKVLISNLDFGVSNEDIKELFSEVGDLKRCTVHYDRSGRSKGTAEVVYSRRSDAMAAMKRYNNVQLDGKPMKMEIIGTNLGIPAAPVRTPKPSFNGRGGLATRGPGLARSGRGTGGPSRRGGRGGRRGQEKSAADLDAELEVYHAEAMQQS